MTLDALIAKLLKIESLHAGATTDGERVASEEARKRILDHLARLDEEPIEMRFTLHGRWSQQLFTAVVGLRWQSERSVATWAHAENG